MPIVLLTTWVLSPHHAVLLAMLASTVAQIHLFPQGFDTADWQVARPVAVGQLVGIGIGTWVFTRLRADWLTLILGLLICLIVLMDRFKLLERLERAVDLRARSVTSLLSVTSGVVGTVSGGGGMYFLITYLKLACPTPKAFRGTNLVLSGFFLAGRVIFIGVSGLMSLKLLVETTLLVPVIFLGTWAGTRFFRTSSAERFYTTLQIVLIWAAIALMGKGIENFMK